MRDYFAVLTVGLRPFYLGASFAAAVSMTLWLLYLSGFDALPGASEGGGTIYRLSGVAWHGHEMIFGMAVAVISGFLLTAVRNWTGMETARGSGLFLLFALWASGRILLWLDAGLLGVYLDILYLPVLAGVLAVPMIRTKNFRNLFVVVLLVMLALCDFIFHLRNAGIFVPGIMPLPLTTAVEIIVLLVAIIGGRVIPGFIDRGLGEGAADSGHPAPASRRWRWVEVGAIGSLVLLLLIDLILPPWEGDFLRGTVAALGAALHGLRLMLWRPFRTRGRPILWALPLAYLWMPMGLAAMAVAAFGYLPTGTALHALTVGLLAGMMLAMMTRSALGHTGRPLRAGNWETFIYQAIFIAALFRFLWGIPGAFAVDIRIAGAFWIAAFAIFFLRYLPFLAAPRADADRQ